MLSSGANYTRPAPLVVPEEDEKGRMSIHTGTEEKPQKEETWLTLL